MFKGEGGNRRMSDKKFVTILIPIPIHYPYRSSHLVLQGLQEFHHVILTKSTLISNHNQSHIPIFLKIDCL